MPERFVAALNNLSPEFTGALMAIFMSILRIVYDKDETKSMRIMLESLMCGALTLTVGAAITALGLNANWNLFIGGTIGFFGVLRIRIFALSYISKRLKKGGDK